MGAGLLFTVGICQKQYLEVKGFDLWAGNTETCILECWFNTVYLTFAEGIETLCGTLSPLTALSMKRNTKKLPSIPAVNTYLSSKLVLMCRMPP